MKLEFSGQIFEKHSNTKFNKNPSSGRRVVPWGRRDRHDGTNCRFSQFCEKPLIMIQFEPHSEQNQPVSTKYETIAVYSKNHTQHPNKLCEQNTELLVLHLAVYTGCPRRNVPDFVRVFLMLKYTDITQTPMSKVERLRR